MWLSLSLRRRRDLSFNHRCFIGDASPEFNPTASYCVCPSKHYTLVIMSIIFSLMENITFSRTRVWTKLLTIHLFVRLQVSSTSSVDIAVVCMPLAGLPKGIAKTITNAMIRAGVVLTRWTRLHAASSTRAQQHHHRLLVNRTQQRGVAVVASQQVKIVEVGPRDGLQNEATHVSVEDKVTLIQKLAAAGCRHIEAGSMVSPKWVPSMANSEQVLQELRQYHWPKKGGVGSPVLSCLVPNTAGLERARQADEISIFASASEAFSQKVSVMSCRCYVGGWWCTVSCVLHHTHGHVSSTYDASSQQSIHKHSNIFVEH